jgi:hypothetical protein
MHCTAASKLTLIRPVRAVVYYMNSSGLWARSKDRFQEQVSTTPAWRWSFESRFCTASADEDNWDGYLVNQVPFSPAHSVLDSALNS